MQLQYLYGLGESVVSNIHYIDETTVVFPCGAYVVVYDTERRTQRFLYSAPEDAQGGITAMAVYTGPRGKFVAVAERGAAKTRCIVTVYDVQSGRRKRQPFSVDIKSRDFVSLRFSPDGQTILAQGGAPDWVLVNYNWSKLRVIQKAKISNAQGSDIYMSTYCPVDPGCLCVTGNGVLKLLRLEVGEYRPIRYNLGNRSPDNYLCHAWMDERLLVGTKSGEILVFVNAEYRGVLDSSPTGNSIECIAAYSKGFVCGCDQAMLYVFERDEKKMYRQAKSYQIDGNYSKVRSLAIAPSEDTVTCTLENSQAYVLSLSNIDIQSPEDMLFEPLALPFHHNAITGLDIAMRKPLVVTCGIDKSVRVWNYIEKTIECIRFFNDEPYTVSIHPSGFQVLVGFNDSLKILNLLMDEMRLCKELPVRGCHEVKFSNSGHLFAACEGPVIKLFQTYTFELIATLKGHRGKVNSLFWTNNDSELVSAGIDGSVLRWSVKGQAVSQEHRQKGCNYPCAVATTDGKETYATGSDKRIKVMRDGEIQLSLSAAAPISQIELSIARGRLFGSTPRGDIVAFQLPLTPDSKAMFSPCHEGACTRLKMTPDETTLFTVSEDGVMAMWALVAEDTDKQKKEAPEEATIAFSTEVLVTRPDLEAQLLMMTELRDKVEDLQHQNQIQLENRHRVYKRKMDDVKQKFSEELMSDREKYERLKASKRAMEETYERRMRDLRDQHKAKMDQINGHHGQKHQTEERRLQELMDRKAADEAEFARIFETTQQKQQDEVVFKQQTNAKQIADLGSLRKTTLEERSTVQADFTETEALMEDDITMEYEELEDYYDKKLKSEQNVTLVLKDKNAELFREFSNLQGKIKRNKETLIAKVGVQKRKNATIDSLEKDIQAHLLEIEERKATILDKAKRISELSKKNQELGKFKFVLDYKIAELKSQNEPREKESKSFTRQLREMQREVEKYENKNANLELAVSDCNQKLKGMRGSIEKQKDKLAKIAMLRSQIQRDMKKITSARGDRDLKRIIKSLKKLYASDDSGEKGRKSQASGGMMGGAEEVHREYLRARRYLERTIDSLKKQLKKDLVNHRRDYSRIMQENVVLVREINELRREYQVAVETQKIKELMEAEKRRARQRARGGRAPAQGEAKQGAGPSKEEMKRTMKDQQEQIASLKEQLDQLAEIEAQQQAEASMKATAPMGSRLPPVGQ